MGDTTQRGYGWQHQQLRAKVKTQVDQGTEHCWRCGKWLNPDEPWDLGHDDKDRTIYRGPECRPCNRATNGRIHHTPVDTSRDW